MYSPVHFISIFIGRHVFNYLSFFFFVCGPLFFLNGTDVDRHLKKVSLSLPLSAGFSVTQAGRSSSRDIWPGSRIGSSRVRRMFRVDLWNTTGFYWVFLSPPQFGCGFYSGLVVSFTSFTGVFQSPFYNTRTLFFGYLASISKWIDWNRPDITAVYWLPPGFTSLFRFLWGVTRVDGVLDDFYWLLLMLPDVVQTTTDKTHTKSDRMNCVHRTLLDYLWIEPQSPEERPIMSFYLLICFGFVCSVRCRFDGGRDGALGASAVAARQSAADDDVSDAGGWRLPAAATAATTTAAAAAALQPSAAAARSAPAATGSHMRVFHSFDQ